MPDASDHRQPQSFDLERVHDPGYSEISSNDNSLLTNFKEVSSSLVYQESGESTTREVLTSASLKPMSMIHTQSQIVNIPETSGPEQNNSITEGAVGGQTSFDLGRASYPQFASSAARRATFTIWNPDHQRPDELVAGGFFYAGYADCVWCFYCGLGLKYWRPGDIPTYQHPRFRPNCVYNRMYKGQEYIDKVQQDFREEQAMVQTNETNADNQVATEYTPETSVPDVTPLLPPPPSNNLEHEYMNLPASQEALRIGWRSEQIVQAVTNVIEDMGMECILVFILYWSLFWIIQFNGIKINILLFVCSSKVIKNWSEKQQKISVQIQRVDCFKKSFEQKNDILRNGSDSCMQLNKVLVKFKPKEAQSADIFHWKCMPYSVLQLYPVVLQSRRLVRKFMRYEVLRLNTFIQSDLPTGLQFRLTHMAQAGFYNDNELGCIRCFRCGAELTHQESIESAHDRDCSHESENVPLGDWTRGLSQEDLNDYFLLFGNHASTVHQMPLIVADNNYISNIVVNQHAHSSDSLSGASNIQDHINTRTSIVEQKLESDISLNPNSEITNEIIQTTVNQSVLNVSNEASHSVVETKIQADQDIYATGVYEQCCSNLDDCATSSNPSPDLGRVSTVNQSVLNVSNEASHSVVETKIQADQDIYATGVYEQCCSNLDDCATSSNPSPDLGRVSYPQFASSAARRATFTGWSQYHPQRPDELVACGFYFAGYADCVRCFDCGLGLKHWSSSDNPSYLHSQFRPNCEYNRKYKGQQELEKEQMQKATRSHLATHSSQSERTECQTSIPSSNRKKILHSESHCYRSEDHLREMLSATEKEHHFLEHRLLCQICHEHQVTCLYLPCRHLITCDDCGAKEKYCGICKRLIEAFFPHVYMS